MRPALVDPNLERLVEEEAFGAVAERDERAVGPATAVLHGGVFFRAAQRLDPNLGVRRWEASERYLLRLELSLARVDGADAAASATRGGFLEARVLLLGLRRHGRRHGDAGRLGSGRHVGLDAKGERRRQLFSPWGKRRSGVGHVAVRMGASRVACGFERRLLAAKTGRMDVDVRVRDAVRVTCPTAPFVRGASTGARDPRRRLMRPVVAFV